MYLLKKNLKCLCQVGNFVAAGEKEMVVILMNTSTFSLAYVGLYEADQRYKGTGCSKLYNAFSSRGFQCVALNQEWFGRLDSNFLVCFKQKKGNAIKYVS